VDELYSALFVGVQLPEGEDAAATAALRGQLAEVLPDPSALDEAAFGELGRAAPKVGERGPRH
jgi:hypothetical protein